MRYLRGQERSLTSFVDWNAQYAQWLAENPDASAPPAPPNGPLVSLILVLEGTASERLPRTLRSLEEQSYPRWELVLVPVSGSRNEVRFPSDRLIRAQSQPDLASALAAGVRTASGDFVALVDPGDELAPSALARTAELLAAQPDVEMVYTDEDVLSQDGRSRPCFKPDWSPDTLLSLPYVGRLLWLRKELALEATGEPLVRGAEEYDLVLRASERARRVEHIPTVLYHRWHGHRWGGHRRNPAEGRALKAALARRGVEGSVQPASSSLGWRVKYRIQDEPEVTIILPCKGLDMLLERCVQSLAEKTDYRRWRISVIDNSGSGALQKRVEDLNGLAPVDYQRCDDPFSFSAICNAAVERATTPYVCVFNDDIEVIRSEWLEAMLEHGQRPEIGAVGAKLLYGDGRVQHAGIAMGIFGVCGHPYKFWPGESQGYFGGLSLVRNVAAVTGACMLVRRSVWLEAGGLEPALPVAYNDVDFCLRLLQRGYRVVVTPYALLHHLESASKPSHAVNPKELAFIQERWVQYIEHDPYYPLALTRDSEDFSLVL
jgi:GT2 family glycosyltransferase